MNCKFLLISYRIVFFGNKETKLNLCRVCSTFIFDVDYHLYIKDHFAKQTDIKLQSRDSQISGTFKGNSGKKFELSLKGHRANTSTNGIQINSRNVNQENGGEISESAGRWLPSLSCSRLLGLGQTSNVSTRPKFDA